MRQAHIATSNACLGIAWSVAHSGRTIGATSQWAETAETRSVRVPTAAEARAHCENLAKPWNETTVAGRRAIAEATFERIDVLGVTDYTITPTADAIAHGWDAAFGEEAITCSISHSGRGGRI